MRFTVRGSGARSTVAITALFPPTASARRQEATSAARTLQPMMEAYFGVWRERNVARRELTGMRSTLNDLGFGLVLVDAEARIVFTNRAADDLLAQASALRVDRHGLAGVDLRDAMALQVGLSHAISANQHSAASASHARAPLLRVGSARGMGLILSIVPNHERAVRAGEVAAIVLILTPSGGSAVQLMPICELYGLSPVEARLVCQLATGASLREAAATLRVKEQTARGYLKQIFLKTDTRRQADLVRVMLSSLVQTRQAIEPAVINTAAR